MITYKDKCFCKSDCINSLCHRHLDNVPENTMGLPIAMGDLREGCPDYMTPRPVCEECGIELHRFAQGNLTGWSCDDCGWSDDDEEGVSPTARWEYREDMRKQSGMQDSDFFYDSEDEK